MSWLFAILIAPAYAEFDCQGRGWTGYRHRFWADPIPQVVSNTGIVRRHGFDTRVVPNYVTGEEEIWYVDGPSWNTVMEKSCLVA